MRASAAQTGASAGGGGGGRAFPDARSVLAAVVALAFLGFLALLYARVSPRLP